MAGIGSYFTELSVCKRRSTCYWEAALEADHAPVSPLPAEWLSLHYIAPQYQGSVLWEHQGQSEPVSRFACHDVRCMCVCRHYCQRVELSAEPEASTVMRIASPASAVNVGLFLQWTEEQELPRFLVMSC
jgi:hypothetical protein